ncbi:MAG: restriction endonuclease subunit S [Bacteroidales bacterium]|nr:restriction endonuclease subunit S [Bacteroidales bacterium]
MKWLGEIPRHWEMKRWRFLMSENTAKNLDCKERLQLQFRYGDIVRKIDQSEEKEVLDTISKYTIVEPDDIMINGLNLNYDFVSQRIAQVKEKGVITSAYVSLRPTSLANSRYYTYFLKSMDAKKMFHGMGTGIRLTLSYNELKNQFIPCPSFKEQVAIANYLDTATAKIDAAIAQQQKMIDMLNERKQIIINNAVTKGLNPNVKMKNSGVEWIGEVPEGWEVNKFKNLYKTRTGITFTKAQLVEFGEPVISYGQIHSKNNWCASVNPDLIKYIPAMLTEGNQSALAEKGDFLFADTSEDFEGCGNNVYIDTDNPIYAGYHTILAKCNNNQYGAYLAYLFASTKWRGQIRSMVNGVKVYSITQSIIKNATVILPPIDEQKVIANHIKERVVIIDKAIKRHNQRISLLQERKQIIINDVVTGKVKICN